MSVPKCWVCAGPILSNSCLHCGRSPEPERVSLGEALTMLAEPDAESNIGPRQSVPLSVSLARVAAWGRGECAP